MKIIISEGQFKKLTDNMLEQSEQNSDYSGNLRNLFKNLRDLIGIKKDEISTDVEFGDVISDGDVIYPFEQKYRMTSGFGKRRQPVKGASTNHKGVDIGAPCGTKVLAASDGVIVKTGDIGKCGGYILLKTDKYHIRYCHLSNWSMVNVGDQVKKGQVIGLSGGRRGMTGAGTSTGCHLHFAIYDRTNSIAHNPTSIIPNLA